MAKKRALCLSGGGSRGAHQIGALEYVFNYGYGNFDIITGVSVGALNGSFLAQYGPNQDIQAITDLRQIWDKIENKTIYKRWCPFGMLHALWEKSLYDSTPLENLVNNTLDPARLKSSGKELRVGVVSLDSGNLELYSQRDSCIVDAVKASASFPVFFKPVKLGTSIYTDGGVKEISPLKSAIDLGAEHITVICTSPVRSIPRTVKSIGNTIDVALRSIELMGDEILYNDLATFFKINEQIKSGVLKKTDKRYIDIDLIQPDYPLIDNSLNFDPKEIQRMIKTGYKIARTFFVKKY